MAVAAPLLVAAAVGRRTGLQAGRWTFMVAGLCMAAYQVCYFSAVPLAGVAATALLAICRSGVHDPLRGGWIRCKEQTDADNRVGLDWRDGRLYVGTYWDDDPEGLIWLAMYP